MSVNAPKQNTMKSKARSCEVPTRCCDLPFTVAVDVVCKPPAGGVETEEAAAAASSYHRGKISSSICFPVTAPKNQGACSR